MAARRRRTFGHIRRLPSRRYQASYVGPDVLRHTAPVTFQAKIDAEGWLTSEHRLIEDGRWTPPGVRAKVTAPVTLEDYVAGWLRRRDLKPRTREHYAAVLDRHVLTEFGGMPLTAITPARVATWHHDLGAKTGPTMRAHAYSLLRTIMASAVVEDEIERNPCRIRGAGSTKRASRTVPLSLPDLDALVAAMPERYRLAVLLSAWCGLRFGELTALTRADVDLARGVLHVRRAVVRVGRGRVVGAPKSDAGVRDVAVPPHLVPAVREHLAQGHAAWGRDGLLFPAVGGGHLAPSTLSRPFYRARESVGRRDLRWHDLRHTGAVLAAATGATLPEMMARLGHSTPGAAMRYQHAAADRDQEIAAALSVLAGHGASDAKPGRAGP